jgi:hypothetical protein
MKLISKQEIIDYLADKTYWHRYDWWPISWNIKVRDWSFTDGKHEDIKTDSKWDDKWAEHLETGDAQHYFDWACEDWLGFAGKHNHWDIMEGHTDPVISASQPRFYTAGRSGGHLVLDEATINNWPMSFDGQFKTPEEWEETEYWDLWVIYKFCLEMDNIVEGIPDHMGYWFADKRTEMEAQWLEEEKEDE